MTRSKVSAGDSVQNLQRRAVELQQQIGKQTISEAMKKHPWCIHALLSKLEALGLVAVTPSGARKLVESANGAAVPPSLQAHARTARSKHVAPGPSPRKGEGETADTDPDDQVPTKYWTLGGLSPSSIAGRLLPFAEPAALSIPNLNSTNVKGQALQNHQSHVRLLEYMTGLPPDFSLSGVYRSWATLADFVRERNECRGRRLQGEVLTIDFGTTGIYELRGADASPIIIARHRLTSQEGEYQRAALPHHTCLRQLFINSNWSEVRATISSTAGPSRHHDALLMPRFPVQAVKEPPRLAIKDDEQPACMVEVCAEKPPPASRSSARRATFGKTPVANSTGATKRKLNAGAFLTQLAKQAKRGKQST